MNDRRKLLETIERMKLTIAQRKALRIFGGQWGYDDLSVVGIHANTLWALSSRGLIQLPRVPGTEYDYSLTDGPISLTRLGRLAVESLRFNEWWTEEYKR